MDHHGKANKNKHHCNNAFVNIGLSGSDNTMYTKDSVRELIKRLNEEVKDGAVLRG